MNPACKLHAIDDDEWNKLELDDRTDVERRIAETNRILESQRTGNSFAKMADANYMAMVNAENMRRVGEMVGTMSLRDTNVGAIRSFMVRELGVVSDAATGNYNAAGWVRESINRVERLSKGGIDKAVRDLGVQEYVTRAYNNIEKQLRKRGIRDADRAYILSESARQGFFPFLERTESLRYAGREYLRSEQDRFTRELIERFKLTPQLSAEIQEAGRRTGLLYNRLMLSLQDAGLKVDAWDVMGRVLTPQAQQRVNWKYGVGDTIVYQNGDKSKAVDAFLRSSASNTYVVEDEVLLDLVIRRIGVQEADDPLYLYKKVLPDVEGAGIADIIDSKHSLIPVMAELLERGYSDVVAALYDSQLLSKIPLSNKEVFDNMKRLMKTPFKELDEVFVTDWRAGLQLMRANMEFMAQQSGFVNVLVKNAVDGSWGVTALERTTDARFANFVPLRDVIAPSILNNTAQAVNPALNNLYVHPFVARMAQAHQEIMLSPFKMGILARAVYTLNRTWSKLALMTTEYLGRQVLQGLVSVGISGSNMLNYPAYVYKVAAAQLAEGAGRVIPGVFDDTAKVYRLRNGKVLTERELYNYLMDIGLASKVDIQLGDAIGVVGQKTKHLLDVKRQARYIADVYMQQGVRAGTGTALDTVRQVVDRLGVPGMVMNNIVNNAALMTIVTSSMRGKTGAIKETIANIVNPNRFSYVEEAVEYAKQFVYYYDDVTRGNRFLQRYVLPFWGFIHRNTPAMLRYVYNHPSRFMALQRIYALAQEPIANDPWLTEGTVPGWLIGGRTIYWKVPGAHPDGRDGYFAVDMNTIDPVGSALEEVDSWLGVFGINGSEPRSSSERLREISGEETALDRFLNSKTYDIYGLVLTYAKELDNEEWQQSLNRETQVGDVVMRRGTRLLLEATAPWLIKIIRFNSSESEGEPFVPKLFGIRVYALDVYKELGMTYDQLEYTLQDLERLYEETDDPSERARLEHLAAELEMDRIKLREFAEREGVDPDTAYETLRERRVRAAELSNDGRLP